MRAGPQVCGQGVVGIGHDRPALADEEAEHALDAFAGLLREAERRGAVEFRLEFTLVAAEVFEERTEMATGPEERDPERVPEAPATEVRRQAEVAADIDTSLGVPMPMPVMEIGIVWMPVYERPVAMPMRMWLAGRIGRSMLVLVMDVVRMPVLMFERFMHVLMLVFFGNMQPKSETHERGGDHELR